MVRQLGDGGPYSITTRWCLGSITVPLVAYRSVLGTGMWITSGRRPHHQRNANGMRADLLVFTR